MKGSHPFDVLVRLVPAQMVTAICGVLVFVFFVYLLVALPLWIGLPAGIAVLAAGGYAVFLILDRMDGDRRSGKSH